jgi:hypothetical protein
MVGFRPTAGRQRQRHAARAPAARPSEGARRQGVGLGGVRGWHVGVRCKGQVWATRTGEQRAREEPSIRMLTTLERGRQEDHRVLFIGQD